MAVGAIVMFIAANPAWGNYGLVIANFGEICITLGLTPTCVRFAKRREDGSPARGAAAVAVREAA
jgi:membrane protein YdbS with pleckstrin-like domain